MIDILGIIRNVNNRYEIDFLIQYKNNIIPIEVKSSKKKNHPSLTKFNAINDNTIAINFSIDNLTKDGKIINIPLYLIEYLENIITK